MDSIDSISEVFSVFEGVPYSPHLIKRMMERIELLEIENRNGSDWEKKKIISAIKRLEKWVNDLNNKISSLENVNTKLANDISLVYAKLNKATHHVSTYKSSMSDIISNCRLLCPQSIIPMLNTLMSNGINVSKMFSRIKDSGMVSVNLTVCVGVFHVFERSNLIIKAENDTLLKMSTVVSKNMSTLLVNGEIVNSSSADVSSDTFTPFVGLIIITISRKGSYTVDLFNNGCMSVLLKYLHNIESNDPPSFQLKRLSSGILDINTIIEFTSSSFIDCNLYHTFTSSKGIIPKNLCVALRSVLMIYYSYISLVSDDWFALESEEINDHAASYSSDSRWAGALLNLTDTVFSLMRDTPRVNTYKVSFGKSKSIPLTTSHTVEITGGDDNFEYSIPEDRYKLSVSYEHSSHTKIIFKSRLRNLHSIPSSGSAEIFQIEFNNTKDGSVLFGVLEMTLKCLNTIAGNDPLKCWTINGILDPAINVNLTRSGGNQENYHYKYDISLDWFKTNNVIFLEHIVVPSDQIMISAKISPPNALPLTSLIQRNVNVNIIYGDTIKGVTIEWKPLVVTSDGLTKLEFIGTIDIVDVLGVKKIVRHLNNVSKNDADVVRVSLTQDNNSTQRLHSESDFVFKYIGHKQLSKLIVDVDAFYNYQGTDNIPIPEVIFSMMGSDMIHSSDELKLIPHDYKNGNVLLVTKNQLIFNGHALSLELSAEPLATVSYITDPLGKGYLNTLDVDVQRLSLQMIELGNQNEEIMAMVNDMNKRIELISNTLEHLMSPSNIILQSLSNLAMFISPIAAVCLQGINTILELNQLVKGDADLGNIMNIITSAILFFVALKTHLNISMPHTGKLDICKRIWDGFKLRSTSGEPTLIKYSKLEDETQTIDPSLYRHMTISRKMKKMDPEANGKIFGLAADIRERIENGTAGLSERVLFRALEKMRIGPWHEYLQITDVEEIDGKIHTKVFITGVADGSAVEVDGALIGSGNVPLSKRADGASPGCITFYTIRDKKSDIAEVVPWRLSGNTWEEIMTSLNYEIPSEKPPEEEIQATYELLAKSFCYELGFDESTKGIYTQREWVYPMMPHQLRALSELINENKINRKYMLVGNNCQNYVRSIENLLFSQERPGAWVSEESYKKYLRSIFDNL